MRNTFGNIFILACGFILLSSSLSAGQTNEPVLKGSITLDGDECGSSLKESQTYAYRQGKVTKILSSNKVTVQFFPRGDDTEGETATIRLVGISSRKYPHQIKSFLNQHLLNQSVTVLGNKREANDKAYGAIITILDHDEIDELNEYLLENGIAYFSDFDSANLVPYYMPCRLEKAQERARAEKLGIWAY